MLITTLCYLERDDKYLMLHRVKKKNDINHDKWIGVGGKVEVGESPDECVVREVLEETGLTMHSWKFRGILTFAPLDIEPEYICLFTSNDFSGEMIDCDEGELLWVPKKEISDLTLWEGDHIFLQLLAEEEPFFSLKLIYDGDKLISWTLNGKEGKTCSRI